MFVDLSAGKLLVLEVTIERQSETQMSMDCETSRYSQGPGL